MMRAQPEAREFPILRVPARLHTRHSHGFGERVSLWKVVSDETADSSQQCNQLGT